jgi:hypothetical protein
MAGKSTHVVPNGKGGWDIKNSGSPKVLGHFATKREAVARARVLSRRAMTELVIHNKDGRIARKDSHGGDPRSKKG